MKPKGNTAVRELLGENKFSTSPDRDYTDETYKRIVGALGSSDGEIKQQVPFSLGKEEKIAIFQDVRDRIEGGQSSSDIARDVVACIDEHLKDKESEAYGHTNPKLKGGKGGFRRVE